jgi:uncharacterized protein
MRRDVLWAPWDAPGLEHLRLDVDDGVIRADGAIIGLSAGQAFRVGYQVTCDATWRVREAQIVTSQPDVYSLHLRADGVGRWTTESAEPLPALDGCVDIDLSATPFTNTLPIRRLGLQPEESAEIAVVYIDAPSLEVIPVRQRYTCLAHSPDGGRYRFESLPYPALPQGFLAELSVDADGLVEDYPPLFHRMWRDA